ncbi:MAG TPA: superoxide dismutase family protein [Actinomycetota bacterium]|nr:superoxide dismutase family protein [Actinomycetota bacterium]
MKRVLVSAAIVAILSSALYSGGASAARPRGLVATVEDAQGNDLGTMRIIPREDGKTTVRITAAGLTPGFHGYHVHSIGVCDPASTDTAGALSPFFSAGGHFNPVTTSTHGSHAGDMPPLLAADDGSAWLKFVTDRFLPRDLMDADGSAVVLHAGPDNLAHVPATTATGGERYHSHVDDIFGADTATKATGDAGARFGCGVLERISS